MVITDILNTEPMRLNERLQSVSDLTTMQQQVLKIVLQISDYTFNSRDIIEKSAHFNADGQAIGGVLGSLYRLGFLEKVAGGRNKGWRLASHVVAQKDTINLELLGAMARATPQEERKPRHEVDEILADLERRSAGWMKQ